MQLIQILISWTDNSVLSSLLTISVRIHLEVISEARSPGVPRMFQQESRKVTGVDKEKGSWECLSARSVKSICRRARRTMKRNELPERYYAVLVKWSEPSWDVFLSLLPPFANVEICIYLGRNQLLTRHAFWSSISLFRTLTLVQQGNHNTLTLIKISTLLQQIQEACIIETKIFEQEPRGGANFGKLTW